ncbi:hypothetical protein QBC40DRAFT_264353 [Triangularia verruculosa]|uniref:Uncharacterized protein n=1 Tax=Triangularia verruculosa TaxID=2587418 RepID=A0AAN7AU72_9PEZI|nr:hypothetical protein QBC40DRAFT_264353 [Triangularia verruculosa]
MPSPTGDTLTTIQRVLDPYIRPREEAAHIRRILALHLDSSLKDGSVYEPLALVNTQKPGSASSTQGLYRQYLEALNANIKAREEFKKYTAQEDRTDEPEEPSGSDEAGLERLQEHLAIISLEKKRERLGAIEKHLIQLSQKPAASPDFMNPKEIFRDSRPLPNVPKELVSSMTLDNASTKAHLKDLNDQLEKHVFKAKLLLKKEEQALDRVKSQSTTRPETTPDSAKLEALNKTRIELISWIEAELSKASGDGADHPPSSPDNRFRVSRASVNEPINMDAQLASIKEKYNQYLEARKSLLDLISQHPKPDIRPLKPEEQNSQDESLASQTTPAGQLLTPYLEQLLALSREQKGLIAQKSHLNNTINKQVKENTTVLDHLAQESQLIPAHLMPGANRAKSSSTGLSAINDDYLQVSGRVKPWVYAAEQAKIATFEMVAEKIEEGQVALEGSLQTLAEIDLLLGRKEGETATQNEGEDDIWMAEGSSPTRKHTRRGSKMVEPTASTKTGTVWDMVNGNLGLLRNDE